MALSPGAWRRHAPALFLLLTTGCAAVPELGPKPLPRAPGDYAAATSLASTTSAWPEQAWWARYRDPQLAQLIEEAVAGSPDLAAAAARVRTAQAYAQRAGAALKPSFDAFATPELARQSQNNGLPAPDGWNDSGSVGLSLSFDLDLWGKNRAALRAAVSDAEAAAFELAEARLMLTTSIASAYADLATLHAQRDSLESALAIRSDTLKLVAQRVAIGLDTRAELKQAEARVPQARSDLAATDEAIELTQNALAALLGAGPDRGRAIGRPAIATFAALGAPANASIELVGRRPDIAAARARVEATASRIKEARAAFYPNINLTALIGLQAFGLNNLFAQGSGFGSVSPAVTLPIFHGGALSANYRGSRGQYDEAVALYDKQVVEALRETADAVTSQKKLVARLAESREALAAYEEANRIARKRYESGLSTYLDVLSAEEGVLAARLAVAELENRAFALDIALIRALGGGFAAS